jgi:pyridoxal phosphate enzyme (YggS family)
LATNGPDPTDIAAYAAARQRVLEEIAAAATRSGRDPASVTLIAISKTVPADRLMAAVAAGLTTLGENRVQEAEEKVGLVPGATWHLVGPLQSNKARRALVAFALIQSVDSVELAERLDRLAAEARPGEQVPVLLQANVDDDPAKAGFEPDALRVALPQLLELANLDIRGLMTVGRLVERAEDARPTFAALRALSEELQSGAGEGPRRLGPELSMGMSGDYGVAIEEGATIVRVGRALFGERHHG